MTSCVFIKTKCFDMKFSWTQESQISKRFSNLLFFSSDFSKYFRTSHRSKTDDSRHWCKQNQCTMNINLFRIGIYLFICCAQHFKIIRAKYSAKWKMFQVAVKKQLKNCLNCYLKKEVRLNNTVRLCLTFVIVPFRINNHLFRLMNWYSI